MQLSLSKVDPVATTSFLRCLYAVALSFELEFNASMKNKLMVWSNEAQPFLKRFKINKKTWDTIIKDVASGSDPNENARMFTRIINFADQLRQSKVDLKAELDLTKQHLGQINDFTLWTLKENENAYNRMLKNVSTLGDPELTQNFVDDDEELDVKGLDSLKKDVEKLTKKLSGTATLDMTQEERKKHSDKPAYKEYLAARREISKIYKARLQHLVRASGKDLIDVKEAVRVLDKEKIPHTIPRNYEGKINEAGWLYTSTGKRLKSNPSGDITLNPNYDPMKDNGYVLMGVPYEGAGKQYYYTEDFVANKSKEKFTKVSGLITALPKMVKKWRRDLNVRGSKSIKALITEIVFETQGRVSNTNALTAGTQTFGITTLQKRHITIKGNVIHIKYRAKKGVAQHHVLKATTIVGKRIKELLEMLMEDKDDNDYIMTDSNGNRVTGAMVNKYLKEIGAPTGVTIHKFRHAKGTMKAQDLLGKVPFDPNDMSYTEAEVTKWFIERMKEVGAELGHVSGEKVTANTAIANYVDPGVMKAFFDKLKVRPPSAVQKAINKI